MSINLPIEKERIKCSMSVLHDEKVFWLFRFLPWRWISSFFSFREITGEPKKAFNENSAYLLALAYSKASTFRNTSNLWGKCPLYGGNATGRLISWAIHYQPFGDLKILPIRVTRLPCVYTNSTLRPRQIWITINYLMRMLGVLQYLAHTDDLRNKNLVKISGWGNG